MSERTSVAILELDRTHGAAKGSRPPGFVTSPRLDDWIRPQADGSFVVFTGKAELGQGILTALIQIVADELDVAMASIRITSADTSRSPDERYTYGSQSIEQSGAALRDAGSQARTVILNAASARLGVDAGRLRTKDGRVVAPDGQNVSYWDAIGGDASVFSVPVAAHVVRKRPEELRLVGTSVPRVDLPAKINGEPAYVQDIRLPHMAFGRIVRPPRDDVTLLEVDAAGASALPGVLSVVRDGDFLGVVASREEQAIAARSFLLRTSRWSEPETQLPSAEHLADAVRNLQGETSTVVADVRSATAEAANRLESTYTRAYLSQGSIGPSCAVAVLRDDRMTVWSHTQGVFPLRGDLATVLAVDAASVEVIHVPGSGCYGQNGADDVACDAALLARALPGIPVKVQWMRDDEFLHSPLSPAMAMRLSAGVSAAGRIVDWQYDVWSNAHAMRPGQPGGVNLLAAWHLATPFQRSPPLRIPQPYGDGDRNAIPLYDLPNRRIVNHLKLEAPIRNGSLRTLGALGNVFAIECFMDELAQASGVDPVEFRLRHLTDERAIAVVNAAACRAGWAANASSGRRSGRGFAFSRYKNIGTYAAVVADLVVDPASGKPRVSKLVIAVDVGQVVNPDGLSNQIEGGAVQGASIALLERVQFSRERLLSQDWETYPVFRFSDVPAIDIVLLDRPDEPSVGGGEGSLGPTVAAIANAYASATGQRTRSLPLWSQGEPPGSSRACYA